MQLASPAAASEGNRSAAANKEALMYTMTRIDEDKFPVGDLMTLRSQLMSMGADYDGAAEVIQAFLSGRGYGISPQTARDAVLNFGTHGFSLEAIRQALNEAALAA